MLGRNLWLFEMSHAGIWEIILVEMQFNLVMVAGHWTCELCQSLENQSGLYSFGQSWCGQTNNEY